MVHKSKSLRGFGPLLFAVAAMAGVALGACREDEGEEYEPSMEVRNSCADYCRHA
jgi:hypothetical protein